MNDFTREPGEPHPPQPPEPPEPPPPLHAQLPSRAQRPPQGRRQE